VEVYPSLFDVGASPARSRTGRRFGSPPSTWRGWTNRKAGRAVRGAKTATPEDVAAVEREEGWILGA
jgi:hypothetical protein